MIVPVIFELTLSLIFPRSGQHDDRRDLMLYNHLPKPVERCPQGSLCRDERDVTRGIVFLAPVEHPGGVDVVTGGLDTGRGVALWGRG